MAYLNGFSYIKYIEHIYKIEDDQSNGDSNYLLIWDTLTVHKNEEVKRYCRENVCELYLSLSIPLR